MFISGEEKEKHRLHQKILLILEKNRLKPSNPNNEMSCTNSGNGVFENAVCSYFFDEKICTKITTFEELKDDFSKIEYINKNFDLIISPCANLFSKYFIAHLNFYSDFFSNFKIPVFILGVGAQSTKDYSFEFIKDIEAPAKKYCKTILNTGGTLSLRGFFSAKVLTHLGFDDFEVIGCPSVFYNGKNFKISPQKCGKLEFNTVFNGNKIDEEKIQTLLTKHKNSCFIDQNHYYDVLYNKKASENKLVINLMKEKRLRLFNDFYSWEKFLRTQKINFSYGSRIHGNFSAILSEIPAFLEVVDSRTRELAEFFEIPNSVEIDFNPNCDDLYELYKKIDYTKFNKNLSVKFDNLQAFLKKHGIENSLEDNSKYKQFIKTLNYRYEEGFNAHVISG